MKENSKTVLECPFKRISGIVSWIRYTLNNDHKHELISINGKVNPGIKHIKSVGNHTIGEYNLLLQRITKADEKIYKCYSTLNRTPHEFRISVSLASKYDLNAMTASCAKLDKFTKWLLSQQ